MLSEVAYCADSAHLFEALLTDQPWSMFLDSGRPFVQQGRYNILVADPMLTLTTRGPLTEIRSRHNVVELSKEDPFVLLRQYLEPTEPPLPDLPFCGGALGYFAYDLGRRIEQLPSTAENAEQIPEMAVGLYDWALVVDHEPAAQLAGSLARDGMTGRGNNGRNCRSVFATRRHQVGGGHYRCPQTTGNGGHRGARIIPARYLLRVHRLCRF
jgi:para-aminobenzoate synthetase component 1